MRWMARLQNDVMQSTAGVGGGVPVGDDSSQACVGGAERRPTPEDR